jgi:hypothetical protein
MSKNLYRSCKYSSVYDECDVLVVGAVLPATAQL